MAESSSSGDNTDREIDEMTLFKSTRRLHGSIAAKKELDPGRKRAVHWIAEIMMTILKEIVARRKAAGFAGLRNQTDTFSAHFKIDNPAPIEEVKDVIALPKFDPRLERKCIDISNVVLPGTVVEQLHTFVAEIALLYRYEKGPIYNLCFLLSFLTKSHFLFCRDNPFHNFGKFFLVFLLPCQSMTYK